MKIGNGMSWFKFQLIQTSKYLDLHNFAVVYPPPILYLFLTLIGACILFYNILVPFRRT